MCGGQLANRVLAPAANINLPGCVRGDGARDALQVQHGIPRKIKDAGAAARDFRNARPRLEIGVAEGASDEYCVTCPKRDGVHRSVRLRRPVRVDKACTGSRYPAQIAALKPAKGLEKSADVQPVTIDREGVGRAGLDRRDPLRIGRGVGPRQFDQRHVPRAGRDLERAAEENVAVVGYRHAERETMKIGVPRAVQFPGSRQFGNTGSVLAVDCGERTGNVDRAGRVDRNGSYWTVDQRIPVNVENAIGLASRDVLPGLSVYRREPAADDGTAIGLPSNRIDATGAQQIKVGRCQRRWRNLRHHGSAHSKQ